MAVAVAVAAGAVVAVVVAAVAGGDDDDGDGAEAAEEEVHPEKVALQRLSCRNSTANLRRVERFFSYSRKYHSFIPADVQKDTFHARRPSSRL